MNPSAFQNAPSAPMASTSSNQSNDNSAGGLQLDVDMDLPALPALPQLPPDEDRPKTKKEQEQEKKDLELAELLDRMDEWRPVIPDEVTDYYLQRSGFQSDDVRVKRLLALAAQRFVASISADAFQYARTRTASQGRSKDSGTSKAKARTRTVLTMEDLSAALKEYGVGADRAAYYL